MSFKNFSQITKQKIQRFYDDNNVVYTDLDIDKQLEYISVLSAKDLILAMPEDISERVVEKLSEPFDQEFVDLAISFLDDDQVVDIYVKRVVSSINMGIESNLIILDKPKESVWDFTRSLQKALISSIN